MPCARKIYYQKLLNDIKKKQKDVFAEQTPSVERVTVSETLRLMNQCCETSDLCDCVSTRILPRDSSEIDQLTIICTAEFVSENGSRIINGNQIDYCSTPSFSLSAPGLSLVSRSEESTRTETILSEHCPIPSTDQISKLSSVTFVTNTDCLGDTTAVENDILKTPTPEPREISLNESEDSLSSKSLKYSSTSRSLESVASDTSSLVVVSNSNLLNTFVEKSVESIAPAVSPAMSWPPPRSLPSLKLMTKSVKSGSDCPASSFRDNTHCCMDRFYFPPCISRCPNSTQTELCKNMVTQHEERVEESSPISVPLSLCRCPLEYFRSCGIPQETDSSFAWVAKIFLGILLWVISCSLFIISRSLSLVVFNVDMAMAILNVVSRWYCDTRSAWRR